MLNNILKKRQSRCTLKSMDERRYYLEMLLGQANNDLLDADRPMDRSRFYNILISGVKLIHDMQTDSTLEDLEKRLEEIEEQYEKLQESK